MSQLVDAPDDVNAPDSSSEPSVHDSRVPYDPTYGQFDYVPMPVVAPIGAVIGLVSLLAYFGLFGILMAIIGTLVGLYAAVKIGRSHGAYAGMKLAVLGLVLSVTSAVGGISRQVYLYQNEVPEGYERVSFSSQISKNAFVVENGVQDIHPDVKALFDKPIFLKGFMYPTQKNTDIDDFLMLKDNGQCCFGGQPELQDMIQVKLPEGVDYSQRRVAVAGKLKVNPRYQGGSLDSLFLFEADYFDEAQTAF
ncbi:MAG: MerC domain-containing protein [Planctomycetaceae bacterium]|nr:MerC domain-containing protein [Planctomycetaceae bacterium]